MIRSCSFVDSCFPVDSLNAVEVVAILRSPAFGGPDLCHCGG